MLLVQDYTETLKSKNRVQDEKQSAASIIRRQVQKEENMIRVRFLKFKILKIVKITLQNMILIIP